METEETSTPSRRWAIVVVAAVVIAGLPAAVLAADTFGDVPDSNVHHDAINAVADAGVTLGCAPGEYCPADNVRRDQMASFMDRLGALSGQDPVVNAAALGGHEAADYRFIDIPIFSTFVSDATLQTSGFAGSGVHMPGGDTAGDRSSVAWGFHVPPTYTAGDVFTVHLNWHTLSTGCSVELRPNLTNFGAVGETFAGGNAAGGLSSDAGTTLDAPSTANELASTTYTIDPSARGVELAPGDSVHFGLFRSTDAAADTCADDLVIHSVGVSY